ncbi:MAG: hypothetical protein IKF98_09380 [Clostridia bacterium]|nr:hypothetical protein [Clostridia bacterium]
MSNKNLTNRSRLERGLIAAVLALLFAGSATAVAASALGVAVSTAALYGAAFAAVALCVSGTLTGGAVLASLGFVAVAGVYLATHGAGLTGLKALFASWAGQPADAARAAEGGRLLLTCAGFTFGVLFFALLNHSEFVSVSIVLLLGVLVACHAMSESASLGAAVPGLIAAAAAFALTGGVQRDYKALRVLVPAAVALAIAVALVPGDRLTWKPLADAAERVRGMFEQYFRFTHERIAFSINEEGYDHAGEVGDAVVSMLGGPAQPHTDPVMRVHTDADALLRGAIRTAYTGYSWVDTVPKSRFLYYDMTHRATRERLFSPQAALDDAILRTDVSVEMLSKGTSTLFVPGMMDGFQMDLSTAVYYNTAGEVFLSRDVQRGDSYRLRALLPELNEALRQAVIDGEGAADDRWQDILEQHIHLPEGIDGGVYTLTMRAIEGTENPFDRAVAIMNYLRGNMRYTLQPDMPPRGRDFVSHFLLDTREGYCSYYASAMAVMGRMAGLPTRYVEGYLARPGVEVLTGENAHAWCEVYFRGVGWIPFDATGGTSGSGVTPQTPDTGDAGTGDDFAGGGGLGSDGDYNPAGDAPTPSPEPDGGLPPEEPEDTPTPEPGEDPGAQDMPDDAPEDADPPEDDSATPPEGARRGGPWWLLLLLALAALTVAAVRWVRKRLRLSDPAALCGAVRGYPEAAMILYRTNLTVLAHLGQAPMGGEPPVAFARRVSEQLKSGDFAEFAEAVSDASYGRQPLKREHIDAGLRAYRRFRDALGLKERIRFTLTRIFRGLGDFERIP